MVDRAEGSETDRLVERARAGNDRARCLLLERYRERLLSMVQARIDSRLAARMSASDVVQEALATAHRRLGEYLDDRPLPLYPWLRQFAWDALLQARRRHIGAARRSVTREQGRGVSPFIEATEGPITRLPAPGDGPASELVRRELRERLEAALADLSAVDREILVMRSLEQMSAAEVAAALGIREGAVRVRHLRALGRLRERLDRDGEID